MSEYSWCLRCTAAHTAGSTPVVTQLMNLNHHSTTGCSVTARCVTVRWRYTVVTGTAIRNVGISDHSHARNIMDSFNHDERPVCASTNMMLHQHPPPYPYPLTLALTGCFAGH